LAAAAGASPAPYDRDAVRSEDGAAAGQTISGGRAVVKIKIRAWHLVVRGR